MKLVGRSAIITGGSQGLGRALAEHFLQEGASVLLMARGAVSLQQTEKALARLAGPGQQVLAFRGDISEPACCAAAATLAAERLPGLCVLVNNAGIQGPIGRFEEVDWEDWAATVRVNLLGPALLCRAFLPYFRQKKYGKIINLSGGGATGPRPHFSAYAAAKAAVVRLTETLACELADDHIDVNAVAPGALNTRLLDEVLAAGPERVGTEEYRRALAQRDGGGASLTQAAALVAFLASAESDGISGRLFSAVWDDWSQLPRQREELARSDVYTLRRITPQDRGMQWKCA
jgi:3-oxoacyl-[acyl-carrier protein] reductase